MAATDINAIPKQNTTNDEKKITCYLLVDACKLYIPFWCLAESERIVDTHRGQRFLDPGGFKPGQASMTLNDNCCKQAWLLKNSIFVKTTKFWGIQNVQENRERRLEGFLLQSFFSQFSVNEFFNSHRQFHHLSANQRCW
jgi:hypothetical protein